MSDPQGEAVYELKPVLDDPRYEGFGSIDEVSFTGQDNLSDDFMPDFANRGRAWTVTRLAPLWKPVKVTGRVRAFHDYPCVDLMIPAFSRRAIDALRDMLEPNGELLPLVTTVGEYYAYNVTTVADILDETRSKISWLDRKRDIADEVRRYAFVDEEIPGLRIFRLVRMPTSYYVTRAFVDRVEQHGLKGFGLEKLYPPDPSGGRGKKPRGAREEDAKTVETARGRVAVKGQTVVIVLPTEKGRPSKEEKQRLTSIMDRLDARLYDPKQVSLDEYRGSLEGHDHHQGADRLFLSCPDADALVQTLRPWLKSLHREGPVAVFKRYGEYVDPDCQEEEVSL